MLQRYEHVLLHHLPCWSRAQAPGEHMRFVHLARHGTHAEIGGFLSGRSEIGLSERGCEEAQRLAAHLAAMPIGAIRTSPRQRTLSTATIIADQLGSSLQICSSLDEIDFGAWAGRSFAELEDDPAWSRWNNARARARPPGGESIAEVMNRALPALSYHGSGDLLCVTHCDVIRAVVAHYLGLSADRMLAFDCAPASLTTIALDEHGTGRIVALNERPR